MDYMPDENSAGEGTSEQNVDVFSQKAIGSRLRLEDNVRFLESGQPSIEFTELGSKYNKRIEEIEKTIRDFRRLKRLLAESEKESEKLKSDISEIKGELSAFKKDLDKLEGRETRTIETLGVFVALFTFLSINIQIFSTVSDLVSAIIFSTLLGGICAFFLQIFFLILPRKSEKDADWSKRYYKLLMLTAFVILIAAVMGFFGNVKLNPPNNDSRTNKNELFSK